MGLPSYQQRAHHRRSMPPMRSSFSQFWYH
jgi:hypothetical protein